MGQNFKNGAKKTKIGCASYARQVRVNLVLESARHLQITRTRQMRVICAASTRESCAGIRASFTNDAYANTGDLPEAVIIHISCVLHCKIDHPHTLHVNGHIAISLPASYGARISQTTH